MKKLKFNSTLSYKQSKFELCEISVERVKTISPYHFKSFLEEGVEDVGEEYTVTGSVYLTKKNASCMLFINAETGDGFIAEMEGRKYTHRLQFIPNARGLIESNEQTQAEKKLHSSISEIVKKAAELAHCGENDLCLDEIIENAELDLKETIRAAVIEMLNSREDIQTAESRTPKKDYNTDLFIEPKSLMTVYYYCPLEVTKEREVTNDNGTYLKLYEPPASEAVGCKDDIIQYLQNRIEAKGACRGLMVYSHDPTLEDKIFSVMPAVKEINGELWGVFECKVPRELTSIETANLRDFLINMAVNLSDDYEYKPIKTKEHGTIYFRFWDNSIDWKMRTEKEMFQIKGHKEENMIDHEKVERIKKQYPEGTRNCLDHMSDDPHPVPDGTKGTVAHIDDIGTIFCKFDNGRIMGVVPEADQFHVIEQEENITEDEQEDEDMEEDTSMTMNMGV